MKAQGVFRKCGENVMITSRKIPLYSRLISIGNNVVVGANTLINKDIQDNSIVG